MGEAASNAVYIGRLREWYRILMNEEYYPGDLNVFDMREYYDPQATDLFGEPCGTAGCAAGFAGLHPPFVDAGLNLGLHLEDDSPSNNEIAIRLAVFFGLPKELVFRIVAPAYNAYAPMDDSGRNNHVAKGVWAMTAGLYDANSSSGSHVVWANITRAAAAEAVARATERYYGVNIRNPKEG